MKLVCLALGGALGTLSRYWLSGAIHESAGPGFPLGTLAVNALGCLAAGFLATFHTSHQMVPEVRLLFTVGFCGAFTTFSTLILETGYLYKGGQFWPAVLNIVLSVLAGSLALLAGAWLGKQL